MFALVAQCGHIQANAHPHDRTAGSGCSRHKQVANTPHTFHHLLLHCLLPLLLLWLLLNCAQHTRSCKQLCVAAAASRKLHAMAPYWKAAAGDAAGDTTAAYWSATAASMAAKSSSPLGSRSCASLEKICSHKQQHMVSMHILGIHAAHPGLFTGHLTGNLTAEFSAWYITKVTCEK